MRSRKDRQEGVLMLEAMIALVLFTLVSVALMSVITQSMNQQQIIQNTRCANWLSDNLLTQEFLRPPTRTMSDSQGKTEQCDQQWQWRIRRNATNDNRFYTIKVEVRNSEGQRQLERQTLRARE
jgi:type II secretion system protein I